MPTGGTLFSIKKGKKSPKSPKSPLPRLDDAPPPVPDLPEASSTATPPLRVDTLSLESPKLRVPPPIPPAPSGDSLASLTSDLSSGTLIVRERPVSEGVPGGGLGLYLDSTNASASASPIEPPQRARSPLLPQGEVAATSRAPSPLPNEEPSTSSQPLPPEHLRPSSRWWQHREANKAKSRPWRNISNSHSPLRKRAKSVSSPDHTPPLSSSPPLGGINALQLEKSPPLGTARFAVPAEQEMAYAHTAKTVARATGREIWDGTKVVVHDLAYAGNELLRVVPIPGVSEAIECLVRIWDLIGQVETNRMACLHLVERCATMLTSVQAEVNIAGANVAKELADPMRRLIDTFESIAQLVQKLAERPFIKRYLKREEIQMQIMEAHEQLTDNLQLFGLAIQIRILREIKDSSAQGTIPDNVLSSKLVTQSPVALTTTPAPPAYSSPLRRAISISRPASPKLTAQSQISLPDVPSHAPADDVATYSKSSSGSDEGNAAATASSQSSFVLPDIAAYCHERFALDCQLDNADLQRAIRIAMDSGSDAELIELLQVQKPEMAEAIKTLRRALEDPHLSSPNSRRGSTSESISSSDAHSTHATKSIHSLPVEESPDELKIHREFIEEEIEALRRSSGEGHELPPWTITRWEIDRTQQIGIGYFSEVFKGQWKGEAVAIKVLSRTTPADLFLHEAQIWQGLKHPNILPLLGASSTYSSPPWFFVSPYMRNGSVVNFLKSHPEGVNHLQMIHEIAVGMQYLHSNGVLHGDLKAVNVLVDDNLHCVISDFGQSKLKSEVYRLSHATVPGGTLRWLAPEAMQDPMTPLVWQADVYAFAISCVEILMDGSLPWPKLSDPTIRHLVLDKDERPSLASAHTSPEITQIIRRCWARAAVDRPSFERIAQETGAILERLDVTPRPPLRPELEDLGEQFDYGNESGDDEGGTGAEPGKGGRSPSLEPTARLDDASPFDDTVAHPSPNESSPISSSSDRSFKSILDSLAPQSDAAGGQGTEPMARSVLTMHRPPSPDDGYETPIAQDELAAEKRNEARYRYYLTHTYNISLNLPLWTPSEVKIGDVGYHKRPQGSFVRLFNAFDPAGSTDAHWRSAVPGTPAPQSPPLGAPRRNHAPPPLKGIEIGTQSNEKRNVVQRGIDWVGGFLKSPVLPRTFSGKLGATSPATGSGSGSTTPAVRLGGTESSEPLVSPGSDSDASARPREVSRKYDFVLRAKHKRAVLVAESTVYRYVSSGTLDIARDWFSSHRQAILNTYGHEHQLQKEDLLMVIGTLDTKDYGLFVNHKHPDGMVHFKIYSERREGEPWGEWTTDTNISGINPSGGGPRYADTLPGLDDAPRSHAEKVSVVRAEPAPMHTLILARLRFTPDSDQPTSL